MGSNQLEVATIHGIYLIGELQERSCMRSKCHCRALAAESIALQLIVGAVEISPVSEPLVVRSQLDADVGILPRLSRSVIIECLNGFHNFQTFDLFMAVKLLTILDGSISTTCLLRKRGQLY